MGISSRVEVGCKDCVFNREEWSLDVKMTLEE